jgi:hypothetical protein
VYSISTFPQLGDALHNYETYVVLLGRESTPFFRDTAVPYMTIEDGGLIHSQSLV